MEINLLENTSGALTVHISLNHRSYVTFSWTGYTTLHLQQELFQ